MKTCVIDFSARANGNCASIAEFILSQSGGSDAEVFHFSSIDINPCGKCNYECFKTREDCPYIEDDLCRIYESVMASGIAYFIVPNYCDYPCSNYFAFNERGQCFFQNREQILEKYLNKKKKFIVVSNTAKENFRTAFHYQVRENESPDILFISARHFKRNSIDGDLMTSGGAKSLLHDFMV
ncbi:MAG: hypothetical protein BWY35_02153 [Firmicutes bacterium ADurb.Bin248]|jgi:multimeric flavodoxin WrbA|nr:MAG: hypothetical protein BWY35_02153 [Firmicutes bacterium ADurb.Bin248]HOG01744.1 hypothetical protein [Clostridia bacterium]HPK16460.1 hypothetical protein [Clostridia bacterium]